jgi:hypothetical protein
MMYAVHDPVEFEAAKQRLMSNSYPSSGDDLLGMQVDFDMLLDRSEVLTDVQVHRGDDPTCLISGTCKAGAGVSPSQVEAELRTLWVEHLRYRYSEAHIIRRTTGHVTLDAITRIAEDGFYVTATVTVKLDR